MSYLASLEVFYDSYRITEYFNDIYFCLCDFYQGCRRGLDRPSDYCSMCRINQHYDLVKLNGIKHDSFKLVTFYQNILCGLNEFLKVDSTAYFRHG